MPSPDDDAAGRAREPPPSAEGVERSEPRPSGSRYLNLTPPPGLMTTMLPNPQRAPAPLRQSSGVSTDSGGGGSFGGDIGAFTMLPREVDTWTTENVSEWLAGVGLAQLAPAFAQHGIDGFLLLRLTERDLDTDLHIPSNLQRVKVYRAISNLRRVHGGPSSHEVSTPTEEYARASTSEGRPFPGGSSDSSQKPSGRGASRRDDSFSDGSRDDRTPGSSARGDPDLIETDVSWIQYVDEDSRFAALAGWLFQKVSEVRDAADERPGIALNAYTDAALGAIAAMRERSRSAASPAASASPSSERRMSSGGGGGGGGGSRSPLHSRGAWTSGGSAASSRGSGRGHGVRLREALDSTPGWDSEHMMFTSKPDVEWLLTRLKDLVEDLKASPESTERDPRLVADIARELGETSRASPSIRSGPLPTIPALLSGESDRSAERRRPDAPAPKFAGGFESDMRDALDAAAAARDAVAERYGMTRQAAAIAVGKMANVSTADSRTSVNDARRMAAVEEAVESAKEQHGAALELEAAAAAHEATNSDESSRAARTAARDTARAEMAEMQQAVLHQQRAVMLEMHCAAVEREQAAMREHNAATTDAGRAAAKVLVQKAVMQQQELEVQEMQQSIMAQQHALATEATEQLLQDAADADALYLTRQTMAREIGLSEDAATKASDDHDVAMAELVRHSEVMREAFASGDAVAIASGKMGYDEAVTAQREARKRMMDAKQSVVEARTQQGAMHDALSQQKQLRDADKARRELSMARAQTRIQTEQAEVMRQAAAIQANVPDAPEGREMTVTEAQRGYHGISREEQAAERPAVDEGGPSRVPGASSPGVEASDLLGEEWEIDFDDIEFPPTGMPSAANRIGHGGFGEVFLGQLGGMNVAVKKLFNQDVAEQGMREFRAEVSILSRLRHPSIVLWLGASTKAPNCTIVLEYMDRGSLSHMLHRTETPYTVVTAIKWCISVARGMLYLHQHKPYPIIHCDLNSNNVLVNRDWVVKITDFGLSKVKRTSRLSRRSGIIGTVNYASPEIIRGAPASEMSDAYAFGVLAWEIFTRKVPWKDLTEYQIIYKMTAAAKRDASSTATIENFTLAEHLREGIEPILHACWAAMPNARPKFPGLVKDFRDKLRRQVALEREGKQPETFIERAE